MTSRAAWVLCLLTAGAAVLAGCEGEAAGEGGPAPAGTAKGKSVSIVVNRLGMNFPAGMDENNNPYLSFIEDRIGLDLNVIAPPEEVYEEKVNLTMSSGNLPDVVHIFKPLWFDHYLQQDALLPLDDWLDKYGADLKRKIPREAWERVSFNGKIYAIPSLNEVRGIELMYVRKDWLDKVGRKAPVTLDEYYDVIKAFTLEDPDGNGKNDTYGLTLGENLIRSAPFFGAFGTQLDSWILKDGGLQYGSVIPEAKEALAFLAKLYTEKLLDPEFVLNRNTSLVQKIENGQVGLYSATWYDTRGPIASNKAKFPQAEWMPLEYPTGPRGQKGVYDKDLIRGYNVIPKGASNPEGAVRYLEFLASDEGYKTLKLGFENQIWSMQNGKMVTDFAQHDKHLYRGIYQSMVDVLDPELNKQRLDSLGDFHLYENLKIIEQNLIKNEFYGSPTPAMGRLSGQLPNLQEAFARIIMGVEPLEAFDRYVEEWKANGGALITEEVNAWYKEKTAAAGRVSP
ncbi:extracellular solute-binding protein [Paenibacillus sp. YN15]|uniref:extracellular solute-binding protein n=1 Tax=Paenibacillus sp. YN15 TaxID=1742774 RepID=UPI000DCD2E04|nr:extracellular solute-binding protein [Paenibacillus sp. YN15]RAU96154.1 peptide permease [Paenibacillus sp. YN15]